MTRRPAAVPARPGAGSLPHARIPSRRRTAQGAGGAPPWCALPAALLAALGGCGGEGDDLPAAPAFAERVPGHAVVVAWGPERAAGGELIEPLAEVAELRRLEAPGVVWLEAAGAPESWPDLATSVPFRRALARLPEDPPAAVFVDLQQVVEIQRARAAALRHSAPIVQALGLEALQYAVLARDAAGTWRGTLATSGRSTGVAALLAGRPAGPSLLGDGGTDERLRVELAFDVAVVTGIADALAVGDGAFGSALAGALVGTVQQVARDVAQHLGGRLSLVATASDAWVACSVTDHDALAAVLDGVLGERRDGRWTLPGTVSLVIRGARLIAATDPERIPEPGTADVPAALAVTWRAPDRSVELEASRRDPTAIGFTLRMR